MPRNVRPSFVSIEVDGRKSDINTGPRRKDGKMSLDFYIRDCGEVETSIKVRCWSYDNTNMISVYAPNGDMIYEHKTDLDLTIPVRVKRKLIESGTP